LPPIIRFPKIRVQFLVNYGSMLPKSFAANYFTDCSSWYTQEKHVPATRAGSGSPYCGALCEPMNVQFKTFTSSLTPKSLFPEGSRMLSLTLRIVNTKASNKVTKPSTRIPTLHSVPTTIRTCRGSKDALRHQCAIKAESKLRDDLS
jgi:hypothetical protein